jgi:uncharacterized membrane protein YphA (DoxX/SURF4 family)
MGTLARLIVAAVFIAAAIGKLRNIAAFQGVLASYAWLPHRSRNPLAALLAVSELALGIALLSGFYLAATAILAAALLLAFAGAFALTFGRQGAGKCGCFGQTSAASTSTVLTRNLSLALLAAVAVSSTLVEEAAVLPVAMLVAVLAASVAFFVSLLPEIQTSAGAGGEPDPDRRRFLKLAGGLVAGVSAAAILGWTGRPRAAEAACHGCGSCGTDYIFSYCVGTCCAAYIIKRWNDCDTYCYQCSTGSGVFCGVVECC